MGYPWKEIGVDSNILKKDFTSKKRKVTVLKGRLDDDSVAYLKSKFKLEGTTQKDLINNLIDRHHPEAINIYILSRVYLKIFSESKIEQYYGEEFDDKANRRSFYKILRIYLEKPDLLKKLYFATLLKSKEYLLETYPLEQAISFGGAEFHDITPEEAEKFAKIVLPTEKQKKTINIWYALSEDEATTFFIYKGMRTRAKIPRPSAKSYGFYPMAKLHIVQFIEKGRKVGITPKDKKRVLRIAGAILAGSIGTDIENSTLTYALEEKSAQTKESFNNMLRELVADGNQNLNLDQIRFKVVNNDAEITVLRKSFSLSDIIKGLSAHYGNDLNADNVGEIRVKFRGKSFTIRNFAEENDKCILRYSSKAGASERLQFENELRNRYGIELSKRG